MPSSSASSRISAASGVSPGLTLPPGNSHSPAIDLPGGRCASRRRPSGSTSATAATSTMCWHQPTPPPVGGGGSGWEQSAPVAAIDVNVAVSEITGPHRRLACTHADIDSNVDLAALHVVGDGPFAIAGDGTAPGGNLDTADGDPQAGPVGFFPGPPDRHYDAPPVGIAGGERGLDERRVADRQP